MHLFKVLILLFALAGLAFAEVHKAPNGKAFPEHWGEPPRIQTRDLRPLPGGYGRGSGTLAKWIGANLEKDAKKGPGAKIAAKEAKIKALEKDLTLTLFKTKEDMDAHLARIDKLKAEVAKLKAGKPANKTDIKAQLAAKEKELAELKDFMSRARFTKEGHQKKLVEVKALETEIARLKTML